MERLQDYFDRQYPDYNLRDCIEMNEPLSLDDLAKEYAEYQINFKKNPIQYKIKAGERFLCLMDFLMNNGRIAYLKGKIYISEQDNCITDNNGDYFHVMNGLDEFMEYFERVE